MQNENMYNIPSDINGNNIPLGLGVAFSNNLSALVGFSELSEEQQLEIIKKADTLPSDGDFTSLIENL